MPIIMCPAVTKSDRSTGQKRCIYKCQPFGFVMVPHTKTVSSSHPRFAIVFLFTQISTDCVLSGRVCILRKNFPEREDTCQNRCEPGSVWELWVEPSAVIGCKPVSSGPRFGAISSLQAPLALDNYVAMYKYVLQFSLQPIGFFGFLIKLSARGVCISAFLRAVIVLPCT